MHRSRKGAIKLPPTAGVPIWAMSDARKEECINESMVESRQMYVMAQYPPILEPVDCAGLAGGPVRRTLDA